VVSSTGASGPLLVPVTVAESVSGDAAVSV
jgi:hypothetical protein